MKILCKTLFFAGLVFLASCTRKPTADQLLKDDDMRQSIMKSISADHGMSEQMINYLTTTDASRDLMKGSCTLMRTVIGRDIIKEDTAVQNAMIANWLFLVAKDSLLCDKTCTEMSNIPQMKRMMDKNSKPVSN
ncbi:MAG TPA: hypothetical protein VK806_04415 [Bacteroidia bacterium]|jgi:hypothetical protein|nr:hypothetical protein [Bacteroidia bacterium]